MIGDFETANGLLRVAGAHVRWQAPIAHPDQHIGYRQARELVDYRQALSPAAVTVVWGDLNVPPESPVLGLFRQQGFIDAFAEDPQPTCNPNRRAQRIDFMLVLGVCRLTTDRLASIDNHTLMPSMSEPSDHLPIVAAIGTRAVKRPIGCWCPFGLDLRNWKSPNPQ